MEVLLGCNCVVVLEVVNRLYLVKVLISIIDLMYEFYNATLNIIG